MSEVHRFWCDLKLTLHTNTHTVCFVRSPPSCCRQITLECLGVQSNPLFKCVCFVFQNVLWPVGLRVCHAARQLWGKGAPRVVFTFVCVCIQLEETAVFMPKNNALPPAHPSSPSPLSSFFCIFPMKFWNLHSPPFSFTFSTLSPPSTPCLSFFCRYLCSLFQSFHSKFSRSFKELYTISFHW